MTSRVAVIAILLEDTEQVTPLNEILHRFGEYIIGRMGIPYQKRGIHIISVAVDAPQEIISSLSGQLGRLPGVTVKAVYSKQKSIT